MTDNIRISNMNLRLYGNRKLLAATLLNNYVLYYCSFFDARIDSLKGKRKDYQFLTLRYVKVFIAIRRVQLDFRNQTIVQSQRERL